MRLAIPKEDPLFAAALRTEPSIFVEDVETASPEIVNLAFEQQTFGQVSINSRSLVPGWGFMGNFATLYLW